MIGFAIARAVLLACCVAGLGALCVTTIIPQ